MTLFDHQQEATTSDDYLTPRWVFDLLGVTFDLDVAESPFGGHVPAARSYTKAEDGLAQEWEGRVWMNPPYSEAWRWVPRFLEHGDGIALLPHAKSAWHIDLWQHPDILLATPPRYFDFDGGSIPYPVFVAGMGLWTADPLACLGRVR